MSENRRKSSFFVLVMRGCGAENFEGGGGGGGIGFVLLTLPAFLPSVISSIFHPK